MKLKVLTFNIHKFNSPFQGRYVLQALKDILANADLDIVLLQELKGVHPKKQEKLFSNDPLEHLADEVWDHFAYGKNSVYPKGHHGNAILSKYPVIDFSNYDISNHSLEKRGILQAKVAIPNYPDLNLYCLHFDLTNWGRRRQTKKLINLLELATPDEPAIVAGDFNDWNDDVHNTILNESDFEPTPLLKTFPSFFPIFNLDKVYYRNLKHFRSEVLNTREWRQLSDHLPLLNHFELDLPSKNFK